VKIKICEHDKQKHLCDLCKLYEVSSSLTYMAEQVSMYASKVCREIDQLLAANEKLKDEIFNLHGKMNHEKQKNRNHS
jgi:hypothetical protein